MSELTNQHDEGHETDKDERPQIDGADVRRRLDNLESTNQRLLDQSKDWKERAFKAEKVIGEQKKREELLKKETAEAEGNWKNLYETERQRNENLERDLGDFQKFVTKREVESALGNAARKLRAHDPSDVIKMIDFSRVDADEKGNILNAESLVAEIKGNKPYMFAEQSLPNHIEGSQPASKAPLPLELGPHEVSKLVRSSDPKEKERGLAAMRQMQAAEGRI